MKKNVAVISLDAYAGQFYAQQVQKLFGDRIAVCSYSVRDGSVEHMPRKYDLYMVTTDAFDSLGDMHRYVPIDGEMMEIHVTLRWDVVHRLQALPAGKNFQLFRGQRFPRPDEMGHRVGKIQVKRTEI